MLTYLKIENFALIERLELEFGPGLNLITGETGSGKSILVDAVELLVGGRASQEMIRQGADTARLEGVFQVGDSVPLREAAARHGLGPWDPDQLIIRREISRTSGNRVFINDRLCT
ncbi:MAG TPA: AAA family ATPase, partial [Acidobacteriota bacterium]|nr:AAA family ATPase [Acidobacteriota bacterium]